MALYFAYLYPVASPDENLEDLPVALVNEDEGGEQVVLGNQVVENATGPDSRAGDTVEWTQLGSRGEAAEGIGRNEYYGAIVIPANYTGRISSAASPSELPIAVVNEDTGAEMQGEQTNMGETVVQTITGPDSQAPGFIRWKRRDSRQAALDDLTAGEAYAAIIIPENYSQQLASMFGPPSGKAPQQGDAALAPEPANIELLTSPAVRPATTGTIEQTFNGIVGGVSGATSEQILGVLSEQGAQVSSGAGADISDPVRGNVSGADISTDAGPLPEAPQPAQIEVLTNPSAGPTVSGPVTNITTGMVQGISGATSDQLAEAAGERGARFTPEVAAVVGNPVQANFTEAEPVGDNTGSGQALFFLAFLTNLAGFAGAAIFFVITGMRESLASRGLRLSQTGLRTAALLLRVPYAALAAGMQMWVAFGLIGVEYEAPALQVFLFLTLAIAAIMAILMVLLALFGSAGMGIAVVLGVLLGLVSAGTLAPLEALPGFYRTYADWLPLRYVTDGLRSLLFFEGRAEAGPGDAVRVLGAYLVSSAAVGYVVYVTRDLLDRRRKGAKKGQETGEATAGPAG